MLYDGICLYHHDLGASAPYPVNLAKKKLQRLRSDGAGCVDHDRDALFTLNSDARKSIETFGHAVLGSRDGRAVTAEGKQAKCASPVDPWLTLIGHRFKRRSNAQGHVSPLLGGGLITCA